ncbi:pentapeptide repeat-containing protein [Streptacidiphilus carbonis]|uniref:pentapeptide repeat-containing protein n=1 Tax=Streptacidiphilus carbonis TaxID=105422 RepID=UPI000693879B|nr:pentapeptide repeat-containing protein [Streptacidiphilus carbonis]
MNEKSPVKELADRTEEDTKRAFSPAAAPETIPLLELIDKLYRAGPWKTQKQFADALAEGDSAPLDRSSITRLRSGERRPSAVFVTQLLRASNADDATQALAFKLFCEAFEGTRDKQIELYKLHVKVDKTTLELAKAYDRIAALESELRHAVQDRSDVEQKYWESRKETQKQRGARIDLEREREALTEKISLLEAKLLEAQQERDTAQARTEALAVKVRQVHWQAAAQHEREVMQFHTEMEQRVAERDRSLAERDRSLAEREMALMELQLKLDASQADLLARTEQLTTVHEILSGKDEAAAAAAVVVVKEPTLTTTLVDEPAKRLQAPDESQQLQAVVELEQLMNLRPESKLQVMPMLCAFIRRVQPAGTVHTAGTQALRIVLRQCANDYRGMVNLAGADLSGAEADGCSLRTANLKGALLRRASLRGTDLTGADLRECDLTDADLHGARLVGAQLSDALGLSASRLQHTETRTSTVLPYNLVHSRRLGRRFVADREPDEPRTLGAILRLAREREGLSLAYVSKRTGVDASRLYSYENDLLLDELDWPQLLMITTVVKAKQKHAKAQWEQLQRAGATSRPPIGFIPAPQLPSADGADTPGHANLTPAQSIEQTAFQDGNKRAQNAADITRINKLKDKQADESSRRQPPHAV